MHFTRESSKAPRNDEAACDGLFSHLDQISQGTRIRGSQRTQRQSGRKMGYLKDCVAENTRKRAGQRREDSSSMPSPSWRRRRRPSHASSAAMKTSRDHEDPSSV